MYRVYFNDKTVLEVDTEQGDKLKAAQTLPKPPVYVDINKNQYKLSKVDKIQYVPDTPQPSRAIAAGHRCRGERSIHRDIYYLYKKELAKGNPRKWEEFRAKAYDYLYTQRSEWCDNKKGTCFCKQTSVDKVMSVFPGAKVITWQLTITRVD